VIDAVEKVLAQTWTGEEVKGIMDDPAALLLFTIDHLIKEKLMAVRWTTSVDWSGRAEQETIKKVEIILKNRGFHTISERSVISKDYWDLHVRWLGAGCPE
jgi:hypothetical protein